MPAAMLAARRSRLVSRQAATCGPASRWPCRRARRTSPLSNSARPLRHGICAMQGNSEPYLRLLRYLTVAQTDAERWIAATRRGRPFWVPGPRRSPLHLERHKLARATQRPQRVRDTDRRVAPMARSGRRTSSAQDRRAQPPRRVPNGCSVQAGPDLRVRPDRRRASCQERPRARSSRDCVVGGTHEFCRAPACGAWARGDLNPHILSDTGT